MNSNLGLLKVFWEKNQKLISYVIIVITAIALYFPALKNETALDDIMVLTQNSFVQEGIKGIPEIFAHDTFFGATHKPASELSWRYRPLSLVMFAVAYEFFGEEWQFYHLLNLFLYAITGVLIFKFLAQWVFKKSIFLSAFVSLAFIVHPVHTEVVANIKSCDELLSLIFILLMLNQLMWWFENEATKNMIMALVYFIMALFSKENTVIFVVLIPILIFIRSKHSVIKAVGKTLPFIVAAVFFVLIRLFISSFPEQGNSITTDPYLFATIRQKLATVSFILFNYVELIFYPKVLIFDYGYNHIPYKDFANSKVLFSVFTHFIALFFSVFWILKRDIKGFFLFSYLIGIVFVSNLFLNVGPPMADRFLYVPSFFMLVLIVLIIKDLIRKWTDNYLVYMFSAASLLIFPYSFLKTRARIADWKNNATLYKSDLKKAPNSFRILAFNGMVKIDSLSLVSDSIQRVRISKDAISLFYRAYKINPTYKMMFKEWGFAYYTLNKIDSAQWAWDIHKKLNPKSPYNKINEGLINNARFKHFIKVYNENYMKGNIPFLIKNVKQAIFYKPDDFESTVLLGKLYYMQNKRDSAGYYWNEALKLNKSNQDLLNLIHLNSK